MEKELTIYYREMIRINPENSKEIQTKGFSMGSCWSQRYLSKNMGNFIELEFDADLLILIATTDVGKVYSSNGGRTWFDNTNGWPIS